MREGKVWLCSLNGGGIGAKKETAQKKSLAIFQYVPLYVLPNSFEELSL
jgi:hypothetical protein